jgi:hypothetical protein
MAEGVYRRGLGWVLRFHCLEARRLGGRGDRYSFVLRLSHFAPGSLALEIRGLAGV